MQKRNKKGEKLVYYYKLREEIRKSGYTQEMLAKELNISTSTLNQNMWIIRYRFKENKRIFLLAKKMQNRIKT